MRPVVPGLPALVPLALALGAWVAHPIAAKLVLALLVAASMILWGLVDARGMLSGLVVWLAVLGLVRRLVWSSDAAGAVDPLLLVLPIAMGVLAWMAAKRGAFRNLSGLSTAVAVLSGLLVIGALNPLQGGLATGVAGFFFLGVPPLAFWVGRGLCDDETMSRLFHLLGALAVGAALYGLMQTIRGFPSWDQAWIDRVLPVYSALGVGIGIRPFGSFSAAAEYGYFLAVGLAVWVGFGLRVPRLPVAIGATGVLGVALLYQSTRTVLVLGFLALGLALAARSRLRPAFGLVAGAAILGLVVGLASRFGSVPAPGSRATNQAAALVSHDVQGLANPLNARDSTLLVHASLVAQGLRSAVSRPLGVGDGAVTIASTKFGGVSALTEVDVSNVAVALGVPGLAAYLAVLGAGLPKAYRFASRRRDSLSLVALSILVITLTQWLAGGLYAVAFLPWLILGWLDRQPGQEAARPAR